MTGESRNILIVEDNQAMYVALKLQLGKLGMDEEFICNASSIRDARQFLRQSPFYLIFFDLLLPDSTSEISIEFIKQHKGEKIVVWSGTEDEELILKAIEAGSRFFLSKKHMRMEDLKRVLQYAKQWTN